MLPKWVSRSFGAQSRILLYLSVVVFRLASLDLEQKKRTEEQSLDLDVWIEQFRCQRSVPVVFKTGR